MIQKNQNQKPRDLLTGKRKMWITPMRFWTDSQGLLWWEWSEYFCYSFFIVKCLEEILRWLLLYSLSVVSLLLSFQWWWFPKHCNLKESVLCRYEPLFKYFVEFSDVAFRVVADNYVTDDSGTGIVHCAPAFGEDDYRVCLQNNVISKVSTQIMLINLLDVVRICTTIFGGNIW